MATQRHRDRLAALLMFLLSTMIIGVLSAEAQTFRILHTFTGGADGATPEAGLTIDRGGRLYGTTGGAVIPGNNGSVFKVAKSGSDWTLSPLYNFAQQSDGYTPASTLVFGPNGALYGTTAYGGSVRDCDEGNGCGTVFQLQPPPTVCPSFLCPWTETVLYNFAGGADGWLPEQIIFDAAGNIYGVTNVGGTSPCNGDGCGTVYKLTPSNGSWTKTILYNFMGADDGYSPVGGLVFDAAGNLYGTAYGGSGGEGVVYELTPSSPYWIEATLHSFQGSDGDGPLGPLIADSSGNLYGVTSGGGASGDGTIFELVQPGRWTFESLYNFSDSPGTEPNGGLILDETGNLYGTTFSGGAFDGGVAFKLSLSGGAWVATNLHDFASADGLEPNGGLVFDSNGNLYGTSIFGGNFSGVCLGIGCGTVWEITP